MDFQRVLLSIALALTLMMMWQAWQKDYGPQPPAAVTTTTAVTSDHSLPQAPLPAASDQTAPARANLKSTARVEIETDLFRAVVDSQGGDLREVDLLHYPVTIDEPANPVRLVSDSTGAEYVLQAGLLGAATNNSKLAPTHNVEFKATAPAYRMADGQDSLEVVLTWTDGQGIAVDKVYTFHRGSYVIDVDFRVHNQSDKPWSGYLYRQIRRARPESKRSMASYTYTGGVIYSEAEKYEKIKFDDMDDSRLNREVTGGWVAMIQHYFFTAWLPAADETNNFYSLAPKDGVYTLGLTRTSPLEVNAGGQASVGSRLYVGPKLQDQLGKIAPGLELTVDYGVLTVIAKPLFWLLEWIHSGIGNWGWAIIFLTLLIKAAFFKLSATSFKSMAKMRKLQPRLKSLQEQYKDDKQAFSQAMMELYRKEKVNPLGGCLPILVQIPVFIALYWMLGESVEMRQAPFALWIHDLSSPDPFYVLPILMGITMLVQHKLNPTPLDPVQAKVMMALPIIFTVFFLFFPAGLVLYWVVNNSLSIAQQWYITRVMLAE